MNFEILLFSFIICEMFELFYVQKGSSARIYIANLIELYQRGVIAFLCMHPTFYIALLGAVSLRKYGFWAVSLIIMKAVDIILKLILLKRLENGEPLGLFGEMIQSDMRLSFLMKASVSAFYVVIFYVAFCR